MEKLKWCTEKVRWVDMIPFENNARKIKAENDRNLEKSLTEFDVVEIPVLDIDLIMIGGHQRRRKMMSLGRGEELTDVRVPNRKLTEEEFKKLNLLLNSKKYQGEYDLDMLAEHFSEFALEDFGIDIPDFSAVTDSDIPEIEKEPEYPIVAKMSEKYTAVVIVIENSIDENFVRSVLGLGVAQDYKTSNVGESYVVTAKQFIEKWNAR